MGIQVGAIQGPAHQFQNQPDEHIAHQDQNRSPQKGVYAQAGEGIKKGFQTGQWFFSFRFNQKLRWILS